MEEGLSGLCIKAGGNNGTKCGRWNPTNEQVKVLTDLFRSGLRTPTTDQIQKISNQLSFYGKIESKNVFYWFQNHKARERHKRRKVDHFLLRDDQDNIHISSPKYYATETKNNLVLNQQSEREIETLELFPLNSYDEKQKQIQDQKRRFQANEYYCKGTTDFEDDYLVTEIDRPPLDLRLSFI